MKNNDNLLYNLINYVYDTKQATDVSKILTSREDIIELYTNETFKKFISNIDDFNINLILYQYRPLLIYENQYISNEKDRYLSNKIISVIFANSYKNIYSIEDVIFEVYDIIYNDNDLLYYTLSTKDSFDRVFLKAYIKNNIYENINNLLTSLNYITYRELKAYYIYYIIREVVEDFNDSEKQIDIINNNYIYPQINSFMNTPNYKLIYRDLDYRLFLFKNEKITTSLARDVKNSILKYYDLDELTSYKINSLLNNFLKDNKGFIKDIINVCEDSKEFKKKIFEISLELT